MTPANLVPNSSDAFGQMLYAHWQGQAGVADIIERDDGLIMPSSGPDLYFAPFQDWPKVEQTAMDYARGRVLDVGCGAGRVALYLQEMGLEVVAIDISPMAIEVCRQRGVRDARQISITQTNSRLGQFDTIIMLGNNFGLFGNSRRAQWLLRRWRRIIGPGGRIIAQTLDPYQTDNPDHLAYHESNRRRGQMGGQVRICSRFRKSIGSWFDYLFISRQEMEDIIAPTGWHIDRTLDSEGPIYVAILEVKEKNW